MPKKLDLTGRRFSSLCVVSQNGKHKSGAFLWRCVCDCGRETVVRSGNLVTGATKSCGCRRIASVKLRSKTHGKSRSVIYKRWAGMIQRCCNKNDPTYSRYGGRGIKVCERWKNFENFQADMLPSFEESLTLERKDNSGNYEPANCIWANMKTQSRNRRSNRIVMIDGDSKTIAEWAEMAGLKQPIIWQRLGRGISGRKLLSKPHQISRKNS